MQIQYIGYKVKGFYNLAKYAVRYLDMITQEALYKAKILTFWEKHGLAATLDAFPVKRRTLFLWRRKLRDANNKLEVLVDRSKRPKCLRQKNWSPNVVGEIRRLRSTYPNISKEKIYPLLLEFCNNLSIQCPKSRTIGRIIAAAPDKMRKFPQKISHNGTHQVRKKSPKLRKPKNFIALHPGHCVALDSIQKIIDGKRRYLITFIDLYSRFAFAIATSSHSSIATRKFFHLVKVVFPYQIQNVLTDNGSEFMKYFDKFLTASSTNHWCTYPRTPKMNAHDERFNRTIQEEFVDYHIDDLIDIPTFNDKLFDYLSWYNFKRPHFSLKLQSPIQFLMLQFNQKCNMYWPDTLYCKNLKL